MKGDFGARPIGQGKVRFRIWAPDARHVSVLIAGQETKVLIPDNDLIFSGVFNCSVGTRYKYQIDRKFVVPDPASRAQAGGVHDDSVVVDTAFTWRNPLWRGRPWGETVIYELHVGALGGFDGVAGHLERLKALGVTAIELMPIAAFPGQRNWGYDGVLPYAPHAAYGTPSQLKDLIDSAHGHGLQVFLDVVYNHFGPDGNYISSYAAEFFDESVHTPWGGAVNFELPPVRRFFIQNALYWLGDYRFDGLRFDAVHAINNDKFLLEMAGEIRDAFPDRFVHLILENENNEPRLISGADRQSNFNAQWTDDWHHCLHVLLTGEREGYYGDFQSPSEQLARCLAEGFAYQGHPSKYLGGKSRGGDSRHLPPTAFVVCLQNHDQVGNRAMGERLVTLADPSALRAAMLLLLMSPQIPMLFMGDEWGETKPFLFFTDHKDDLADVVREGRRKEFMHFAAFSHPEARENIPDPNAVSSFLESIPSISGSPTEVDIQCLAFVHQCLALRALRIVPKLTTMRSLCATALNAKSVRAQWQFDDRGRLTIAANFGDEAVACEAGEGDLVMASSAQEWFDGRMPERSAFVWLTPDE